MGSKFAFFFFFFTDFDETHIYKRRHQAEMKNAKNNYDVTSGFVLWAKNRQKSLYQQVKFKEIRFETLKSKSGQSGQERIKWKNFLIRCSQREESSYYYYYFLHSTRVFLSHFLIDFYEIFRKDIFGWLDFACKISRLNSLPVRSYLSFSDFLKGLLVHASPP